MKLITWNAQWCCSLDGLDGRVDVVRIAQDARDKAD